LDTCCCRLELYTKICNVLLQVWCAVGRINVPHWRQGENGTDKNRNRKPRFFLLNLPKPTDSKIFETVTTLPQMVPRSVQPFCTTHPRAKHTNRHMHRPCYVRNMQEQAAFLHCVQVMWPKNIHWICIITAPPAERKQLWLCHLHLTPLLDWPHCCNFQFLPFKCLPLQCTQGHWGQFTV